MSEPYKLLDLFSGIGGFSLGLERSGAFQTVAFCEIEPFCRRVLAKHWPEVPCYDDVRTLTAERLAADGIAVDVICGGFPCQDISTAGKRAGLAGERSGLWGEYLRLVRDIQPRYVFVENVSALRFRGLGDVLGDLAASGYDALWECIPASAVGAPHGRDRVWILAYPEGLFSLGGAHNVRSRIQGEIASRDLSQSGDADSDPRSWCGRDVREPGICPVVDGVPDRVAQLRACGNAVVPQIPELIGRAIAQAERAA